jgi:hypothetical protein
MSIFIVMIPLLVALTVGKLVFRLVFDGTNDFWDCVRFSLTPNIISLFRGQFSEDIRKSMRLGFFMIIVGGSGALTFVGMVELLS